MNAVIAEAQWMENGATPQGISLLLGEGMSNSQEPFRYSDELSNVVVREDFIDPLTYEVIDKPVSSAVGDLHFDSVSLQIYKQALATEGAPEDPLLPSEVEVTDDLKLASDMFHHAMAQSAGIRKLTGGGQSDG
jgi:hypothetical protein